MRNIGSERSVQKTRLEVSVGNAKTKLALHHHSLTKERRLTPAGGIIPQRTIDSSFSSNTLLIYQQTDSLRILPSRPFHHIFISTPSQLYPITIPTSHN